MTDKQATKLLNESGNIFENFISRFYIKFGKLQIKGFHGKAALERTNRTVSPRRAWAGQQHRFSANPNAYPIPEEGLMENEDQYLPYSQVVRKHAYQVESTDIPTEREPLRDHGPSLLSQEHSIPSVDSIQVAAT